MQIVIEALGAGLFVSVLLIGVLVCVNYFVKRKEPSE